MRVTLEQAINRLKNGEVVAIPTETVYGLAANARNDNALKQIYAIKERPSHNPLIVHLPDHLAVTDWASEFSPLAQKFAAAFWPGPFTMVLPALPHVSSIVRAGAPTVALRVPGHPVALNLLQQSGLALAAPSANKFTQLSPTTPEHVEAGLGQDIAVLEGGACQVGIESTIVAVQGDNWQLLRHGMITPAQITQIAQKEGLSISSTMPKAPGQHLLHYSPKTNTYLFDSAETLQAYAHSHENCIALVFTPNNALNCPVERWPNKAEQAAERLYSTLHRLDTLGKTAILIERPPQTEPWLAILDRLTRAAHRPA
jgi:L-threonylcarbamoyladenylate synthase